MRRDGAWLAAAAAAVCLLALSAPPALAIDSRPFAETFGSAEQPAFGTPRSLAVDQATGEVLVVDAASRTLSRWNADGTPSEFAALGTNVIDGKPGPEAKPCGEEPASCDVTPAGNLVVGNPRETQVAVDESGGPTDGNIYLTQSSRDLLYVFSGDGEFLSQLTEYEEGPAAEGPLDAFGEVCGVAVDAGGALYVGDYGNQRIHKYLPVANPPVPADNVANFDTVGRPCTMAAGAGASAGSLFVTNFNAQALFKIDSESGALAFEGERIASSVSTAVVDPVRGRVVAAQSSDVVEFDASGGEPEEEVRVKTPSFVGGIALHGATDRLHVSRAIDPNLEVYGAPVPVPVPVTGEADPIGETEATLNGTVDPEGFEVDECAFEYLSEAKREENEAEELDPFDEATTVPCAESPAAIGSGGEPVPVHADIAGLDAGARYFFRLKVVGFGIDAIAEEESFATRVPPELTDAWLADATNTEATIRAKVNPRFYPTELVIEYGPDEGYGQTSAPVAVGTDSSLHTVTATLVGLEPGTTYHWRAVASSENGQSASPDATLTTYRPLGSDTCPNAALRPGPGANLPDCRAYEMVSPVDKGGGDIASGQSPGEGTGGYYQAAQGGERLTYTSTVAFGDAQRAAANNQYLASRRAGGWASGGLHPPQGETVYDVEETGISEKDHLELRNNFYAFTSDLCGALMVDQNQVPLTADAIHGYTNLYLRDNCGAGAGSYEALTTGAAPSSSSSGVDLFLEARNAAPAAAGHMVFAATAALTGNAAVSLPNSRRTQIYDRVGGATLLVSVLPEGGGADPDYSAVGTGRPDYTAFNGANLERAVAEDGSAVFWTSSVGPFEPGDLYVRVHPGEDQSALDGGGQCTEPAKACTLSIHEGPDGRFWTADLAGTKAIYSAGGELLEYDVAAEESSPVAGEVGGVAGASRDLSHLYFTSKEAIAGSGENEREEEAIPGEWNLYLRDGAATTFIVTLAAGDRKPGAAVDALPAGERASQVSPDGRHLAFMSVVPLTGYDNTDAASGEANREVFLYDADTAELICASCNPSGARPVGRDLAFGEGEDRWTAAWIPTSEWSSFTKRALSEDGGRLFFNSLDALLPADTNDAQDVYQWEAPGTGSCHVGDPSYFARNEGCVSLISTGKGSDDSKFLDASASGADTFFFTNSSIDRRDPGLIDVYDARVGGGFPPPEPEPDPCVGDACQDVPPPPAEQPPASGVFQGPGNLRAGADCGARARRAAKLSRRAKRARRAAKRSSARRRSRALRRRSARLAKRAKRLSTNAKRCRRANRRAGR